MAETVEQKFSKLNRLWSASFVLISVIVSCLIVSKMDTHIIILHKQITPMIEQACFTTALQEKTINIKDTDVTVLVEYNPIGTYEDTVKFSLDISTNQADSYESGEIDKCTWLVNRYSSTEDKLCEGLLFYEMDKGILTLVFIVDGDDKMEFVKSLVVDYSDDCLSYLQSQQVLKMEVDENVN